MKALYEAQHLSLRWITKHKKINFFISSLVNAEVNFLN